MSIKNIIIKLVESIPFGLRSRIKNTPGLKQLQSFLLKRWVDKNEFVATISGGPAKGLVFPVQMPQDKLMWIGTWELDFAQELQQCIQPGWICYDIGGYKGYYAGIMALKGASKVYVFEPMPSNIENIKKLIHLNRSLPITLQQYAVSDTTGKSKFKIMPEETMGKLIDSAFLSKDTELGELTVDCITLDDLIKNGIPEPDFIKIDVEGAEENVLRGSMELLRNKKPFLMIEIHSPDIGKRCLSILNNFYSNIKISETKQMPGMESGILVYTMQD
jgi:FkbM family methyltransferase